MKKYVYLAILMIGITVPTLSFAQSSPYPASAGCVSLQYNMRYQTRDYMVNGEVSKLQSFLRIRGYLNSPSTGYFGLLTLSAAKRFQTANYILSSGYVGPITRAKISALTCVIVPPAPCTDVTGATCPYIEGQGFYPTPAPTPTPTTLPPVGGPAIGAVACHTTSGVKVCHNNADESIFFNTPSNDWL